MAESIKQKLGFVVAAVMVLAALGALNLGSPADAQAQRCESEGGGGGTASPSPSPSETEEPFPPSLPPIIPEESESSSPSPTNTEGGQARNCPSEITMSYQGPTRKNPGRRQFVGKVRSEEDACETGRKVLVKKVRGGRDRTVDSTVTNQRGSWKAPVRRANGRYYAQTPSERVPSDSGRVTCGADRSKTIRV